MPWELRAGRDDQWCVHKVGEDTAVPGGCHPTRAEALAHQRALYANERTASVAEAPVAAGVALVAADTGRVLMIQRCLIDGEPAGGKWEFPGGKLDEGEGPLEGALREFAEEVGQPAPEPWVDVATWLSADGVYRCYVLLTPSEDGVHLNADPENRAVDDPDNPDQSNYTECVAWFDPADLTRGPRILREEVRVGTPWKLLTGRGPAKTEEEAMTASGIDPVKLAEFAEEAGFALVKRPDPLPADMDSLVASLGPLPAELLAPGDELPGPTPFSRTADGRGYDGHLALWASCHIGYPGCLKPPREESFDFYNLTPALLSDGRTVGVGRVTVGTGHAGPDLSWRTAAAHYDNSGSTVAIAHAIPDRWGIRMPSVIVAGADPAKVEELDRSPLSGDWRKIHGGGSPLRLVAALGVNVPGYPVPVPQALVAAGEVQSMFVGFSLEDAAAVQAEADELASELGLDVGSRAEALRAATLG